MNSICERNLCTSCGLCVSVCPKKAIIMTECTKSGHYIPKIDEKLCIDCGVCQSKCPSLHEPERHEQLACYAAWRSDKEKLEGSSSGGVASAFYEYAIENGFICVGTYLDSDFRAKMELVDSFEKTSKFKGSKYIQSDSNDVYAKCILHLKNGKKVFFVGTPCQCAAMRTIAGNKFEDNLVTVELICHGTPSYKIFKEYLSLMEKKKKKKVTEVLFRSEKSEELTLKAKEKTIWRHTMNEDEYMYAFQNGILFNECCYDCKYANKNRSSDITIGDFWKIGTKTPFTRPDCKVSVVVVNTKKGEKFLDGSKKLLHLEERTYEEALFGNSNLHRPSVRHKDYEKFWKCYGEKDAEVAFNNTVSRIVSKTRLKNTVKKTIKKPIKAILHSILKNRRGK